MVIFFNVWLIWASHECQNSNHANYQPCYQHACLYPRVTVRDAVHIKSSLRVKNE